MKLTRKLMAASLALCAASPAFALFGSSKSSTDLSPAQVKQVEQIVHTYLVKNPQVLVEAGKALQKQQMDKVQNKATGLIHDNAKQLFNDPNSIVLGNANGKITLVEFYDYQCAHCRDSAPTIDALVKANPNLRVVFKELPIFGKFSQEAAVASLAAYNMDKANYFKFHDALMKQDIPFKEGSVAAAAKDAGIDYAKLQANITANQKQYDADLAANLKLATTLLKPTIGFVATPALVIGNTNTTAKSPVEFMPGQADQATLQGLIDKVKNG